MRSSDGEKSCVLRIARCVYCAVSLISVPGWIEWFCEKRDASGHRISSRLPFWVFELWVLGILFAEGVILVALRPDQCALVVNLFATYILLDVLRSVLRDTVISLCDHRDADGEYISIRNRPRWLILTLLGAFQIILAFAILIKWNPGEFNNLPQADWVAALYLSTVTFTTLGYGDITPNSTIGRCIVTTELFYFLLFLAVRLPIAVAVARVEVKRPEVSTPIQQDELGVRS